MDKEARIYIAGHRGLVGSALVRKIKEKGYKNIVVRTREELDLRRQKDTEDFFVEEKPEYVFLAAAKVGGILANTTYKSEFMYDNIMIATNVIHASYNYGIKKLLNLGSSCIYPKNATQPLNEKYLLSGELEPTNEPYALAKIAAIKLCRYYDIQYGTNFISIMPTNLYGPHDNFNLETSHVLPALIRKFHLAQLLSNGDYDEILKDLEYFGNVSNTRNLTPRANSPSLVKEHLLHYGISSRSVTLWGSGNVYREFLYVDDLAEASVFLMENYGAEDLGEFINIGTGEDLKIKVLADIIKEIIGFRGTITWDISQPDGTPRKLLNISKIKKMGWTPKVSLEEGVKRVYEWYLREIMKK